MKIRTIIIAAAAALLAASCVPQGRVRPTRNVIFLLTDGTSTSALSVARWYKQYTQNTDEGLAMDPYYCGLVRVSHTDSPIVGSAGSMTSYMTGELVTTGVIGVYPKAHPKHDMVEVDTTMTYHPLANLADVARREQGKSVGVVATTYFCHATPAAATAHVYKRSDFHDIAVQMAASDLDVCFGGGGKFIDDKVRSILEGTGTTLIEGDYDAFRNYDGDKLWAIFNQNEMNYDIDREEGEPSLAEMTSKAIKMLSKNRKGFFLMVEGSIVDYADHANDPAGVVSDLLAFDEAVKVSLDFAKKDRNTTVVVITDHGCGAMNLGRKGYSSYSARGLADALGSLPDYKRTSYGMEKELQAIRPYEYRQKVLELLGIDLTDEEEQALMRLSEETEADYMKVGSTENIQSMLARIMTSRTSISFGTTTHTGEDVFMAIYNPHDQRPEGWHTNLEINRYVADVMGIRKPMRDYTMEYFIPHTELLEGTEYTIGEDEFGEPQLEFALADGRAVKVPAGSCFVTVGDSVRQLVLPAVYISQNGTFYLTRDFISQIR